MALFFGNARRKKLSQRTSQLDPRTRSNDEIPEVVKRIPEVVKNFHVFFQRFFLDGQFHNLLIFNHCYMICLMYNALKHEHMNKNKEVFLVDVLATHLNKDICEVGVCCLFFGAMRDLLADPSHGRLLLSSAMSMESSRTST